MSVKFKSYIWITSIILSMLPGSVLGQRQVTVSEAIDSVLALNPNVLMSKVQVHASRSKVSQATATLLPQLYANAGYTHYEEPNIVTPIHQQGVFPPLDDEIYEANLQLFVPIFDGGRRLTQRKIASVSVDENRAKSDLIRNEVLKQVAEIFLYARQTDDQSSLINKRLKSLYQHFKDLQNLENEGRVSKGDLALVSSLIASTKSDSSAIAFSRFQLSTRLSTLLGTNNTVAPAVSARTLDVKLLADSYPRTGFEDSDIYGPDVRISEARVKKAKFSQSLASRGFWPEISGYGAYGYRTGSDWDPVGEWAIGVKVSLPLFTGGSRISKIKETASLSRASEEALRNSEIEQFALLRTAYDEYRSALDRNDYLSKAVKEKSISLQAQVDLYEAGRIPLRDLYVQETELLQLQLEQNAQQYIAHLALLRYETSAGSLNKSKVLQLTGELQ